MARDPARDFQHLGFEAGLRSSWHTFLRGKTKQEDKGSNWLSSCRLIRFAPPSRIRRPHLNPRGVSQTDDWPDRSRCFLFRRCGPMVLPCCGLEKKGSICSALPIECHFYFDHGYRRLCAQCPLAKLRTLYPVFPAHKTLQASAPIDAWKKTRLEERSWS